MVFREIFADGAQNSAVAASGSETLKSSDRDREKHVSFNSLEVVNRDITDIEIRLDGLTTARHRFIVPAGTIMTKNPVVDAIPDFSFFVAVNLDSANAQTATKINYRWAKMEMA